MRHLNAPPVFRSVRLRGGRLGQLGQFDLKPVVTVNPSVKVDAPIRIELGGLPLSIGLFAGAGVTFLMRGALPKGGAQTAATIAGAGLAAFGVMNLFTSKAYATDVAAGKPMPPAAPATPPPTSAQGEVKASAYQPSAAELLGAVTGRIVSPRELDTIDIAPWEGGYPVRVELQNPTPSPVPFVLEMIAMEEGIYGPGEQASYVAQVTVPPGAMNYDFNMPIVSGHALDTISVTLTAYKRRTASDPAQILDIRSFLVK